MSTVRIAVSLPRELLDAADAAAARKGTSRSALMREALEAALECLAERETSERYVKGYQAQPEEADEVAGSTVASRDAWSSVPWQ